MAPDSRYSKGYLIQFCYVVISLETIRLLFGQFPDLQVRIDDALRKTRSQGWRGVREQPSISHGITGNAFIRQARKETIFLLRLAKPVSGMVWWMVPFRRLWQTV
jgi:hypothetical protein